MEKQPLVRFSVEAVIEHPNGDDEVIRDGELGKRDKWSVYGYRSNGEAVWLKDFAYNELPEAEAYRNELTPLPGLILG